MIWPRAALWVLIGCAVASLGLLLLGYRPIVLGADKTPVDFFTSALSVIVAVLALSIAGLLTAEQLNLEREDRSKERRLSAKHAVLMDGVRGLNKMLAQIPRLASVETDQSDISKSFGEGFSQAAPAWAVAELPTVARLQRLTNDVSLQFMKLSQKRFPLVEMADDCDTFDKVIDSAHADNSRLFQLQTDATGSGDADAAKRWHQLFEIAVAQMPKLREDRDAARKKLSEARVPYLIECIFEGRRLRNEYQQILARVRAEIEVDDDASSAVESFLQAADLQDQIFVDHFKGMLPPYRDLIDRSAREAGCRIESE
jgi:hypothetical protein